MWVALKTFASANIGRLLEIFALIAGGAAAVAAIFKAGQKSERVRDLERIQNELEGAHAIEDKNLVLPDATVAQRLRDRWSR